MKLTHSVVALSRLPCWRAGSAGPVRRGEAGVKEKAFDAPNGVRSSCGLEGPYTADVPLQSSATSSTPRKGQDDERLARSSVDKKLGGVIASLRERGEFVGDEGETYKSSPRPRTRSGPRRFLLHRLGREDALSLEVMERVGK